MTWQVHTEVEHGTVHTWPNHDDRSHVTEGGLYCWCDPDLEVQPSHVVLVRHRDDLDRMELA